VPSNDAATFAVVFSGTLYSKTTGRKGPAVIDGHSVTHFTATKEIVFQPGSGFSSSPPRVEARSECFTDGIASTRGGLIGRVVQRRAAREIAEQQGQITAIARDRATRRIAAAFETKMGERLARLNRVVETRTAFIDEDRQAGNLRFASCTTPHAIFIAAQRGEESSAIPLSFITAMSQAASPIEVWIHSSLVPEKVAEAMKKAFSNPEQSAVVNALALLPGTAGKDAAAAIAVFASENHVSIERFGDWVVLDIHAQPPADFAASGSIRR
jgi:hypothetical protein